MPQTDTLPTRTTPPASALPWRVAPPLISTALVYLGTGILGTLMPLRLSAMGLSPGMVGLLATAEAIGFLAGCLQAHRVIAPVGLERAYAAFAGMKAVAILGLHFAGGVPALFLLRFLLGANAAGLAVIVESWLNALVSNAQRGRMLTIYVLVVGWFRSFITPLVIMAPIPLTLVGILPAHAMMGAFFTATSMIGFIAGAGIIVRNSIILVDFIELRRSNGMSLEEAVVDAGAVRFRPMLLTAAAVVVGASVILFDPIFQGLAISLMAGEVASTVLSRMTVPVLYYLSQRGKETA